MPAINSYQYDDYSEFGSGDQLLTGRPQLPPGYYFVNRSASNPAPPRPAAQQVAGAAKTTKKTGSTKQKASKPKARLMKSEPVSVSYDGGKTWVQTTDPVEGQNVFRSAVQEDTPQQSAIGYDTSRGLEIMDALTQMYPGINPDVAAGVAGNFLYESYGLPNIYEGQTPSNAGSFVPETGGFGLAQWTGPRRKALMAMPNPETLATQMQYFAQENAGPERSAWEATMAAPTLEDATRTFATQWERPGVPALERRLDLAQALRSLYGNRENLRLPITTMPIIQPEFVRPEQPYGLTLPQERTVIPTYYFGANNGQNYY